ncbi:hypothetical protein SGRIM128S_01584 [Streptomyces griseomycini]
MDRYGQARIAVPATLFAALGSLALVLCVRTAAPDWTLFAAYAATATTPTPAACPGPLAPPAEGRP